MASTYSSTLNLEIQASGENSGTWGTITNNNLQKLESAIKGYVSVAVASTSDSLTASDGSTTDEQSNAIIKLTGSLTGNTTMQCEAVESWYIVDNATTMGTYTLGFKPAGGTATNLVASSKHILKVIDDTVSNYNDNIDGNKHVAFLEKYYYDTNRIFRLPIETFKRNLADGFPCKIDYDDNKEDKEEIFFKKLSNLE